jgi:hypothetical protein
MNREKLASQISIVVNPLLLTLATFIPLILKFGGNYRWTLFFITSFFGFVLPFAGVLALMKKGLLTDLFATERTERYVPFLASLVSYLLGTLVLIYVQAPPAVTALMATYFVNGLVLVVITTKWKISIHASGVTSPVTALVYLLGSHLLPLFLIFLPVAWARLELKAHNKMQLTMGALLSGVLTWIEMGFFMNHVFLL